MSGYRVFNAQWKDGRINSPQPVKNELNFWNQIMYKFALKKNNPVNYRPPVSEWRVGLAGMAALPGRTTTRQKASLVSLTGTCGNV